MKTRNGFVSNSSSSSFILVCHEGELHVPIVWNKVLNIPRSNYAETDFNGGEGKIFDFDSKLNFIVLQAIYADDQEKIDFVNKVLLDYLGKDIEIRWNLTTDYFDMITEDVPSHMVIGSIDHQSILHNDENMDQLFESEENLKQFLFNPGSYLEMGRD